MFNKDDKILVEGLIKVLNEGTFELKGKDVPPFIKILLWCKELKDKIENDLNKPKEPELKAKAKKKAFK